MRLRSLLKGTHLASLKMPLAFILCILCIGLGPVSPVHAGIPHKAVKDGHRPGLQKQLATRHHQARKIHRLARYIQKRYAVPQRRASAIVTEAVRNGTEHGLHPELILAIIAVESRFEERAVGRGGARGLMQIIPRSHPHKVAAIGGAHALLDARKNISAGTEILADCLDDSKGNLRGALLRYNGNLSNRKSRYPDKVLTHYRKMMVAGESLS